MIFDQAEFDVRCEWGRRGLLELAPGSDVVVIVDILSFTTAVEIATARGCAILPCPWKMEAAAEYARSMGAHLASADRATGFSLSPASLLNVPRGYRLALPSPNGAALCFEADHPQLLAACLRNAAAVARMANVLGSGVAVIPAGEKWPGGELRPSLEDLIGAGAVIAELSGSRSPEAEAAVAAFERFRGALAKTLRESASGRELRERGAALDVELAAELNESDNVPRLVGKALIGTVGAGRPPESR